MAEKKVMIFASMASLKSSIKSSEEVAVERDGVTWTVALWLLLAVLLWPWLWQRLTACELSTSSLTTATWLWEDPLTLTLFTILSDGGGEESEERGEDDGWEARESEDGTTVVAVGVEGRVIGVLGGLDGSLLELLLVVESCDDEAVRRWILTLSAGLVRLWRRRVAL